MDMYRCYLRILMRQQYVAVSPDLDSRFHRRKDVFRKSRNDSHIIRQIITIIIRHQSFTSSTLLFLVCYESPEVSFFPAKIVAFTKPSPNREITAKKSKSF